MTRRPLAAAVAVAIAVTSALLLLSSPPPTDGEGMPGAGSGAGGAGGEPQTPIPIPIPGHEVFGYVPYWEMDEGIAEHVATTELTTLALFSVTHSGNGTLATGERGYKKIVGPVGERLIADARARSLPVELVYTSFGRAKNDKFFTKPEMQDRTIAELVAFAAEIGVDGINVDVELLAPEHVLAYGAFVGRLRTALQVQNPDAQVSVATAANIRGMAMARVAADAGADRIFLMGYDYHWSGSEPGASAPLDRRDGSEKDLAWSLDLYRDAGVPAERTILGLPLYGMAWPVDSPEVGASGTGKGKVWIPSDNLATFTDSAATRALDPIEVVEHIVVPDGDRWRAIYVDSPASLTPKLSMADERGLAGAGFWAIGYERGLPEYTQLVETFRAGAIATPLGDGAAAPLELP